MSRIGSAGFSALHSFNTSSTFSSVQLSLDAASYGFSQEALHGSSLAAMMAGGLAYRLGKVATFSSFSALNLAASFRWIPRLLAPVLGLSAEVTAFEGCQRLLSALNGEIRNQPNLLSWSGEGGFAEGWRKSFLEFGVLKSVGHLLRSENFILQHLSQDIAMVSSHYVGAWVGWSPHPEGSILDQLLHAEITNIQLSVGMHLSGRLLGGSVSVLERNVDWRALTHFSAGKNEVGNSGLSELSWMNANPPDR